MAAAAPDRFSPLHPRRLCTVARRAYNFRCESSPIRRLRVIHYLHSQGYLKFVMLSSNGCNANKEACNTVSAMIGFAVVWCLIEIGALFKIFWRDYRDVPDDYRECAAEVWIRWFQVHNTLPSLFIIC